MIKLISDFVKARNKTRRLHKCLKCIVKEIKVNGGEPRLLQGKGSLGLEDIMRVFVHMRDEHKMRREGQVVVYRGSSNAPDMKIDNREAVRCFSDLMMEARRQHYI